MANKYTYPRVTVSHTAKQHSSVQPAPADTTVMFVPILTKKGPSREIVAVHSLSEFINIFGNLDYTTNGQMALNLYNWLRNGGTAYVYRIAGYSAEELGLTDKDAKGQIAAKIVGNISEWSSERVKLTAEGENPVQLYYSSSETLNREDLVGITYYYESSKGKEITRFGKTGTNDIYVKGEMPVEGVSSENIFFYAPANKDLKPIVVMDYESEEEFKKEYTYSNVLFILNANTEREEALALEWTEKNDLSNQKSYGSAKYFGEFYNNIEISIDILQAEVRNIATNEILKKAIFTISVYERSGNSRLIVESFPRRTKENYKNSILSSDYIGKDFDIDSLITPANLSGTSIKLYMYGADDAGFTTDLKTLPIFWQNVEDLGKLQNPTETPIDIMFDAGYPLAIKQFMMKFINNANGTATRPDIVGIFDTNVLSETDLLAVPTDVEFEFGIESVATNIALYGQAFTISDEIFTSQNIYVTPTYFLAKLIAYNDLAYGIQFPTAGIRRAILDDAESIYKNPNADTKQAYFDSRINYAEKTPREYSFMSQRTHDNSSEENYTALSFLNNIRVLEKMKKELERLGRNYLFEFNDAVTLSQLSAVLNNYVSGWIANRTLASGLVTVSKNPWSDEAVDVNLTIKFNGTIEVISVDITIE